MLNVGEMHCYCFGTYCPLGALLSNRDTIGDRTGKVLPSQSS